MKFKPKCSWRCYNKDILCWMVGTSWINFQTENTNTHLREILLICKGFKNVLKCFIEQWFPHSFVGEQSVGLNLLLFSLKWNKSSLKLPLYEIKNEKTTSQKQKLHIQNYSTNYLITQIILTISNIFMKREWGNTTTTHLQLAGRLKLLMKLFMQAPCFQQQQTF